jgi:hypothetical protein
VLARWGVLTWELATEPTDDTTHMLSPDLRKACFDEKAPKGLTRMMALALFDTLVVSCALVEHGRTLLT